MSRLKQVFVLLDGAGRDTKSTFWTHRPSSAALQAASAGHEGTLLIREQTSDRVHVYRNERFESEGEDGTSEWRSRIERVSIVGMADIGLFLSDEGAKVRATPDSGPARGITTLVSIDDDLCAWVREQPDDVAALVNRALRALRDHA